MVLSDFLSRQEVDDSDSHEIIPISFSMRNVLQERYYNLHHLEANDRCLVQTRSQTKSSRISLPEVHGNGKGLDPHVRPEKQKPIILSSDVRALHESLGLVKVEQVLEDKWGGTAPSTKTNSNPSDRTNA